MKNALLFVSILFFATACNNNSDEEVNVVEDSLKTVISEKDQMISEKEANIESFIEGYNAIQENIDLIKEKEKILAEASKESAETRKNKQEQIVADIQAIYDALNQNKQQLNRLYSKLNNANKKNADLQVELQRFTERLTAQLEEKELEINDLKTQLENLNVELTDLRTTYEETVVESQKKSEKLNTAYYTFGTTKELTQNGVLTKGGGFIGIGKIEKMKEDFNKNYFTKIDIQENTTIILSAKKAKLVTTHPAGSYKIQGVDDRAEKLVIVDPEAFWSVSKYLVVVVD